MLDISLMRLVNQARGWLVPGDLVVSNFDSSLLRTDIQTLIGGMGLGVNTSSRGCIGPRYD